MNSNSVEETIEGFRIQKITSKKLHNFLETEGISKKKWLEGKIENDLDMNVVYSNKDSFIVIPKLQYAVLFDTLSLEVAVNQVYNDILFAVKKNANWSNYLVLLTSFCNQSHFELTINEDSTNTTINFNHKISKCFSDMLEVVWAKIADYTKEVKLEECIKTNSSIIMKFEKL